MALYINSYLCMVDRVRILCMIYKKMSFDDVVDFGNLLHSASKCCNGSRWKKSTQLFEINKLQWVASTRKKLINGAYKPRRTFNFTISERGKTRQVKSHHISDRMVYKSFVKNELDPNVENLLTKGNSASQEGKGTDYAINKFKQDLLHAFRVCGNNDFYVFTWDFHNYFGEIPHERIKTKLGARLSDNKSIDLLNKYVDVFPGDVGVGIGGEPSQVIAITYPSRLDRLCECNPATLGTGRFMDDGYIIMKNKSDLRKFINTFIKICNEERLIINEKHTKIHSAKTDNITFLKKRTTITSSGKVFMRLVHNYIYKSIKELHHKKKQLDKGIITMENVEQSFISKCSYMRKYNSHRHLIRYTQNYCRLFDIPWEDAIKLWSR